MLREGSVICRSAGWLPVTLAAFLGSGMIVAYIWAVARHNVHAWLPFISNAGGNPPQSGVFAIFLFSSAVVGILAMLVRYASLYQIAHRLGEKWNRWLNHASLGLGFVCILGMVIVASYPVHSSKVLSLNQTVTDSDLKEWSGTVLLPHTLGAMFCFVVGLVYAFVQALLSLRLKPAQSPGIWQQRPRVLFAVRIVLCFVAAASIVCMFCIKGDRDSSDPWKNSTANNTKALFEWILALMLILLFLSLYPEMKTVQLEVITQVPPSTRENCPDGSSSQIVT